MNGISCSLNFDDLKQLIIESVAKRLEPDRLLGECTGHVAMAEDGRVEVTFAPKPPSNSTSTTVSNETAPTTPAS